MTNMTKAHFDHGIYFLNQLDWTVYAGTFAHFYGCPYARGIPSLIEADELVEMIGMNGILVRREGETTEYPVKDAPQAWKRFGLAHAKRKGFDYDSLPEGNPDEQTPIYPEDE
jgi:hypothetical protein